MMCILPAVVFWGISFDTKTYETAAEPVAARIIFILLAIASTVPFIMFWIKIVKLLVINHMNNLLEADTDGFVPVNELARAMGTSEARVIKKVNGAIRKGYLVNINYRRPSCCLIRSLILQQQDSRARTLLRTIRSSVSTALPALQHLKSVPTPRAYAPSAEERFTHLIQRLSKNKTHFIRLHSVAALFM